MAATPAPPAAPPKPTWDPGQPEGPFPWLRPTIRIRLTLLYGGMFLIAGILLLSIIYLLAAQALREGNGTPFKIVDGTDVTVISNTCPGVAARASRSTSSTPPSTRASWNSAGTPWTTCSAGR